MIFLIPAENVFFHNFPAAFTRSGGVVTGGGGEVLGASRASEKYISDSPGRVRCEFMVLFLA